MSEWSERCQACGVILFDENGLIVCETPDEAAKEKCRELGRGLARW